MQIKKILNTSIVLLAPLFTIIFFLDFEFTKTISFISLNRLNLLFLLAFYGIFVFFLSRAVLKTLWIPSGFKFALTITLSVLVAWDLTRYIDLGRQFEDHLSSPSIFYSELFLIDFLLALILSIFGSIILSKRY